MKLEAYGLLSKLTTDPDFMPTGGTLFYRATGPQLQGGLRDCECLGAGRANPGPGV